MTKDIYLQRIKDLKKEFIEKKKNSPKRISDLIVSKDGKSRSYTTSGIYGVGLKKLNYAIKVLHYLEIGEWTDNIPGHNPKLKVVHELDDVDKFVKSKGYEFKFNPDDFKEEGE